MHRAPASTAAVPPLATGGPGAAGAARGTIRRFSTWAIVQHAAMIVLFTALLVTGLPQKWPRFEASQWIVDLFGGIFITRWVHRVAGIVFGVLTVVHLAVAIVGLLRRRIGPTMIFTRQDFRDAIQNLRYCLGRAEHPPRFGRYDYRQKFEYWGLIFGGVVMIASGLLLMYPIAASRLMPAEFIPAAKALHSNEALMALLIVLIWHMYGAHLNPEVFPFDASIFTGRISRQRMLHEHPLELEAIDRAAATAAGPAAGPRGGEPPRA